LLLVGRLFFLQQRFDLDRNEVTVQDHRRALQFELFHHLRHQLLDLPMGEPSLEEPGFG
jgi:hypothetical protein